MFDNDNIELCAWMDICSLNVSLSEGKIYILGQLRLLTRRDWNRWNGLEQASSGIISAADFYFQNFSW